MFLEKSANIVFRCKTRFCNPPSRKQSLPTLLVKLRRTRLSTHYLVLQLKMALTKDEKEEIIPKPVSEVKIEFATEKDKQIEKFFDIQPVKKTLKIKKSQK